MKLETFKIQISGCVQGVGFRPFVFNLAIKNKLLGSVSNNANGVLIYIKSSSQTALRFLEQLLANKPQVSNITSHSMEEVSDMEFDGFRILVTENKEQIDIPLTPDFSVCKSCRAEIKDVKNRRFNYAFTTCVHCGPRYAITTKFPFERQHTTLYDFEMCSNCKQEYIESNNKRFHSQTNSCNACGIQLELRDALGNSIAESQQEIIRKVAQFISEGDIIAIKNTNGYLLCCDAGNEETVYKLRLRKERPNKPFAVLYPNIESVKNEFVVSKSEENALQSSVAPIVILQNTSNSKIANETIAPNLAQTGVMLPCSSLLELIMQALGKPVVATSGNIHGAPIISEEEEAQEQLKSVADYFLHHTLDIGFPQDDSVVKFMDEQQLILRRSRGLAPNYLEVKTILTQPVLAMGSHLKSTFCFVPNTYTYVSQCFGNLDSYDILKRLETTINKYTHLFSALPKQILIDKHPNYQSSILGRELGEKWGVNVLEIQHHKAHFASVLGEHDLFNSTEKIMGVVWDGTGLGDDNMIWGGEFFMYENQEISRYSHFEYYDWIANDKMATEPRLSLFSLLKDDNRDLIKDKFSDTEWKIYTKVLKNNKLKTSSVGRLFDAVASALDMVDFNSYEAEAAMVLEKHALMYTKGSPIDLLKDMVYNKLPSKVIIAQIIKLYKEGVSKEKLAFSFLYTLAQSIITIAKKSNVEIIACSGGVFQNSILVSILNKLARTEDIQLKLNRKLSANDENISFGQLMYHQHIKN